MSCILCAVFCVALLAGTLHAATIKWYGYDEGVLLSKNQKKKTFLYFWADWCRYCEKMEKETLSKKEIVEILNNRYIPIKINSDAEKSLATRYSVRGLPTAWFLSETGEKISNLPGYVAPDIFLPILRYIDSDSYKKMTFKEFLEKK